MSLPLIAVSIGDLNGIGIEIALRAHHEIKKRCRPLYMVHYGLAKTAAEKLGLPLPEPFEHIAPEAAPFTLAPGTVSPESGAYSFASFKQAVEEVSQKRADAVVTLPIHKEAWMLAGIPYKGHTDALRDFFKKEAIMMLGCEKLYVGLFTEHIPLKEVPGKVKEAPLTRFLLDFQRETGAGKIAVLGLNPHAGDHGVLGDEEETIRAAIDRANASLPSPVFTGPLVPDIAFSPQMRKRYTYYVAMYHDQGLAPLKALYFDESINVSLNLPIIRTSVDHGTAFDIAYLPDRPVNLQSYVNAVDAAVKLSKSQRA
ncbi:4-hydroxythreonine-4-phosphate dehydrogenase [Hydrogenimonas sp. SS33]|uniref:4-hydroxythreonine-4-phosphate dehydrogenase n=1 Tax=Hydrogenimonas leucolamina TaxID=2954236 RepID=UPI00336BC32D